MDRVLSAAAVAAAVDVVQRGGGSAPPPPPLSARAAGAPGALSLSPADFRTLAKLIHDEAGIVLGAQKQDMVLRRLSRRMHSLGLRSFREYAKRLQVDDGGEREHFRNALTTNLTAFFRESHHFDRLNALFAQRGPTRRLRVWSAACSTGEEPYSIAICACEHYGRVTPPVQILATDVDTQVLATARAGVYPLERLKGISEPRRRAYFDRGTGPNEGLARVREPLRRMVQWQPQNLMAADYAVEGGLDAIFLRNVLIYFDRPTQRTILARMRRLLRPDGWLFVGHSENLFHCADLFRSLGQTVYAPLPP